MEDHLEAISDTSEVAERICLFTFPLSYQKPLDVSGWTYWILNFAVSFSDSRCYVICLFNQKQH